MRNIQKQFTCFITLNMTLLLIISSWGYVESRAENMNEVTNQLSSDVNEILSSPAGWSDDVRLTDAVSNSDNPDLAINDDHIYIVWKDYRSGIFEVYFKKSENGGLTWSDDVQISTVMPSPFCEPKIAIYGSNIHVVWTGLGFSLEIQYRNSYDGGETWNPEMRLTADDGKMSYLPIIRAADDNIHVMWNDDRNSDDPDIYYRNSTNGGADWNQEQRLTTFFGTEAGADMSVNGSKIHIVWARWLGNQEMFYMNSLDGGTTWSPEKQLFIDDDIHTVPSSIAVWENNVHLAFYDVIEGTPEVYYINSTDGGSSWSPRKRISDLGNHSYDSDIIVDGDNVHVVWMDDRDYYDYVGDPWGPCEIYYSNSSDGGITWSSNNRLTYAKNQSTYPEIAVSNGNTHIVWQDNRTTGDNTEIYYKRYPDFPPDPEYNISLSQGWNLISLPLEQSDESLDQVLQSIDGKWNHILTYNTLDPDHWKTNGTIKPDQLNDLKTLDHRVGFWINITEADLNLTISGDIPTSTSVSLYAGWNLVGYPSLTEMKVSDVFWGTGADRVEIFDPASPYQIKEVEPTYMMKPGDGYWVHVPVDTVWIVDW